MTMNNRSVADLVAFGGWRLLYYAMLGALTNWALIWLALLWIIDQLRPRRQPVAVTITTGIWRLKVERVDRPAGDESPTTITQQGAS